MLYKVPDKELVKIRNSLFLERGLPALEKNGFIKSPYTTAWFGRDNHRGFSYELLRLKDNSTLEMILVYIIYGEPWIQEHINVFRLSPEVSSLTQLAGLDGLSFHLPPCSMSLTRLAPPRGLIFVGFPRHKLRFFFTKTGFERRVSQLGEILEKDLTNIDSFFTRWHAENQPLTTDWLGRVP